MTHDTWIAASAAPACGGGAAAGGWMCWPWDAAEHGEGRCRSACSSGSQILGIFLDVLEMFRRCFVNFHIVGEIVRLCKLSVLPVLFRHTILLSSIFY